MRKFSSSAVVGLRPGNLFTQCFVLGCLAIFWSTFSSPLAAQPINDNFNNAEVITGFFSYIMGSNVDATIEAGEPQVFETFSTVWYSWQASTTVAVNIFTDDSTFDTVLAIYTGTSVSQLVCVVSNDDEYGRMTSLVGFESTEGVKYYIQVGGNGDREGDIRLNLICAGSCVSNDNFDQATSIFGGSGKVSGTSSNATLEVDEPSVTGDVGGHSVWYRWIAPHDGNWVFTTDGSQFDTMLGVCTGAALSSLAILSSNDDSSDDTRRSAVHFNAVSNRQYYISVDGYDRESGGVVLNWGETPANDNFSVALVLGAGMGFVSANNVASSREAGEPTTPGTHSIWYRWIAPSTGFWTFNTQPSNFDTWLAVYSGSTISSLSLLASSDDVSDENHTSSVVISATNDVAYYVVVDGISIVLSDYSLDYSAGNVGLNWFPFRPQILQASSRSNEFGLSFWTTYGTNYVTERKGLLTDAQWDEVANCIGSGVITQVVDHFMSTTQGFYRVRAE